MNNFSYEENGYNKKEVNSFVDSVITNTENLVKKCNEYEKKINSLTKELNSYRSKEKELGESLIKATEISHTIRENALKERDSLLSSVNEEKETIIKAAYQKLQDIELKRLTIIQNIQIYKEKLKFILKEQEKYLKEIDISVKQENKVKAIFSKVMDTLKNCSLYITLVSCVISLILLVIVLIDKPKLDLLYSFLGPQIKEVQEQRKLAAKYNEIVSSFKNITADEIANKYKEDKLTFVYYGRSGCQYCVKYAPIVKEVAKEKNIEVNYFNADQLTQEGAEKLIALNNEFNSGLRGTPFTFAFKNGKLVGTLTGYVDKQQLANFIDKIKNK